MASSNSDNPNSNPDDQANGISTDKPRLTEKQKKDNHIASEQKRRQAIRGGFDKIAALCGREGQGRSEAMVLERATEYLEELLAERIQLLQDARAAGIDASKWELDTMSTEMATEKAGLKKSGS